MALFAIALDSRLQHSFDVHIGSVSACFLVALFFCGGLKLDNVSDRRLRIERLVGIVDALARGMTERNRYF